jgi:hypothetical protein
LTGDFTAEAWVYHRLAPAASASPFGLERAGPFTLSIKPWTDRKIYLGDTTDKSSGTTVFSLNAWHHMAITRTGTTIRQWLDGVQEGATYTSAATYCASGMFTYVGSSGAGINVMGFSVANKPYLDLLRITKGVDRYGSTSFTPPADY